VNEKAARGAQLAKPPLVRMYAIQGIVLLLGAAGLIFVSKTYAYSALFGGLISIVPNMYFARWAFRYSGARAANDVTRSFYRGEAGKFLLTVALFAGVFVQVTPLEVVALFLTYIFMMALNGLLAFHFSQKYVATKTSNL
jgi:ATP synthase protein I